MASKDKKYFTLIPNIIIDNSTAIDQALYLQIKRISGETGKCKASEKYFCKQLKTSKNTLRKSFKYLLGNKWIIKTGKVTVMTSGGMQQVNCYIINSDIWSINTEFYNKGRSKYTPPLAQRWVKNDTKGRSKYYHKEEPIRKNNKNNKDIEILALEAMKKQEEYNKEYIKGIEEDKKRKEKRESLRV